MNTNLFVNLAPTPELNQLYIFSLPNLIASFEFEFLSVW